MRFTYSWYSIAMQPHAINCTGLIFRGLEHLTQMCCNVTWVLRQNPKWIAQQLWLQVASAKMAAMSSLDTFLKREMETIRLHACKDAFQTFDLNTSTWFAYQWHSSHSFKMFPKLSAHFMHFEASVINCYHGSLVCWNDPTPSCYSDCQWLGLNLLGSRTLGTPGLVLPAKPGRNQTDLTELIPLLEVNFSTCFEQHTRPEFCKWLSSPLVN